MLAQLEDAVIQKEVLRDKIFEILKGWILEGRLKPGDRLVESLIAKKLNVSRAPLREALWQLSQFGFVVIRPHQGTFVTQLSDQDIREIFEVREVLETQAAIKAHATMSAAGRERLLAALQVLEAATLRRDLEGFTRADFDFHRTLWSLSGNRQIEEILTQTSTRFFGYKLIRAIRDTPDFQFDQLYEEHRKLVDLVLDGPPHAIAPGFQASFRAFLTYVLGRFAEHSEVAPRS